MATSSITGIDEATSVPEDNDTELFGPSDLSDSGSDSIGINVHDSDSHGSGEGLDAGGDEIREAGDILPDRIVGPGGDVDGEDPDRIAAYEDVAADEDADETERRADGDDEADEL